jgi:hypothetical protein
MVAVTRMQGKLYHQDWKGVSFGVHKHSKGILHAGLWAMMSEGQSRE